MPSDKSFIYKTEAELRLYEHLKVTFNVINVQFSHFGSIWTNISETVHVSNQLNVCMKYMCGSVDYRYIFNV